MKKKATVSQEELRKAVKKYLNAGGRIQKLPDQKNAPNTLVGHRWNSTEVELNRIG